MTVGTEEEEEEQGLMTYRTVITVEGACLIIAQYLVGAEPDNDGAEFVVVIPIEQWPIISNDIDILISANTTNEAHKKRKLS